MKISEDQCLSSPAEKLLEYFDASRSDSSMCIDYVALIHSNDNTFRLKFPKGRPSKLTEAPNMMNIHEIRKRMRVNNGQDVLLSVAWITPYEKKMVQKFPQLFAFDVTEKTNIEQRGLFVATGIDGNGKIFPAIHCFMPNAQAASFNWIYTTAIPTLWPKENLQSIQSIITDGEDALFSPLENLVKSDPYWKNVRVFRYV